MIWRHHFESIKMCHWNTKKIALQPQFLKLGKIKLACSQDSTRSWNSFLLLPPRLLFIYVFFPHFSCLCHRNWKDKLANISGCIKNNKCPGNECRAICLPLRFFRIFAAHTYLVILFFVSDDSRCGEVYFSIREADFSDESNSRIKWVGFSNFGAFSLNSPIFLY